MLDMVGSQRGSFSSSTKGQQAEESALRRTPPVEVRSSDTHGVGVFATRDLAAGELVLAEPQVIPGAIAVLFRPHVDDGDSEGDINDEGEKVGGCAPGVISICNKII